MEYTGEKKEKRIRGSLFLLCLIFLFSVVGCQKKSDVNTNQQQADGGGADEVHDSGSEGGISVGSTASSEDIQYVSSDTRYYAVRPLDSFFERSKNQTAYIINVVGNEFGAVIHMRVNDIPESDEGEIISRDNLFFLDTDGQMIKRITLADAIPEPFGALDGLQLDTEGDLFLFVHPPYDESESINSTWVWKLSSQGELLGDRIVLTPQSNQGMRVGYNQIFIDNQNHFYATGYKESAGGQICFVSIFDETGTELFKIEDRGNNTQDRMSFRPELISDGEVVYISGDSHNFQDYDEEDQFFVFPIDVQNQILGEDLQGAGSGVNFSQVQSQQNGVYYWDDIGVYRIDIQNDRTDTMFFWKDTDLDRSKGYINRVIVLSDEKVLISRMEEDDYLDCWYFLEKQDENPNIGKKILRIGGYQIASDPMLQQAVDLYNHFSKDTRAEVFDYSLSEGIDILFNDRMKIMNMAILSGDIPDILYNPLYFCDKYPQYVQRGLFVDLREKVNTDLQIEGYFEDILFSTESEDGLYYLYSSFGLQGYWLDSSLAGDRIGWSIDDFETFANSLPEDAVLFLNDFSSSSSLLHNAIAASGDFFFDQTNKKVQFDSSEFLRLLEFARKYGVDDTVNWENQMNHSGEGPIMFPYMLSLEQFFQNPGETSSIVGYPTLEATGPMIYPNAMMGISSTSLQQEEAWIFIKNFFEEEMQNQWSLPVLRSSLDLAIEETKQKMIEYPQMWISHNPSDSFQLPDPQEVFSDDRIAELLDIFAHTGGIYFFDQDVLNIVGEEAQAYFAGQKNAEDVAGIIQSRAMTLINER